MKTIVIILVLMVSGAAWAQSINGPGQGYPSGNNGLGCPTRCDVLGMNCSSQC